MEKKRNINLDVIRCIALIYVIGVHFFMNASFYYAGPIVGPIMETSVVIRNAFSACVALFITLSGYLMNRKTISTKYFLGLSRILIIYGLSLIPKWMYSVFVYGAVFNMDILFKSFISFADYAWYIAMYIGLYLLIPFLNLMYHGLANKKQKILLICILLYFTGLPSITNIFGVVLIPYNWVYLYPFTYYFIGAFLSEYKDDIKISAPVCGLLYIAVIIAGGMFVNRFLRGNMYYAVNIFVDYNSLLNFTATPLLFLTILKCDFSRIPNILSKFIQLVSKISLQMYLVSWVFDQYVYAYFNAAYPAYESKFLRAPLILAQVFACSFVVGWIIQIIYDQIMKIGSTEVK